MSRYQLSDDLRSRLTFGGLFAGYLGLFSLALAAGRPWFGNGYLYPLSWAAAHVLRLMGIPTELDQSLLGMGTCVLTMERLVFEVTCDCGGVFALLVYVAAVLAHPTTGCWRATGIAAGTAALFGYAVARLVALALIGHLLPGWLDFLHSYLLVLMNVGFVLFLWISWMSRAPAVSPRGER